MSSSQPLSQEKTSTTHRWFKAAVLKQLKSLSHGSLTVVCDGESHTFGQAHDALHAELREVRIGRDLGGATAGCGLDDDGTHGA